MRLGKRETEKIKKKEKFHLADKLKKTINRFGKGQKGKMTNNFQMIKMNSKCITTFSA